MSSVSDCKVNSVPSNLVQCKSFDGEPWFRNNVVAKIQVYARSNNAIIDKVLVKSNSHSMLY